MTQVSLLIHIPGPVFISRLAQLVYCPSAKRKPYTGLNQPERKLRPLIDNLFASFIPGKRNRTHVRVVQKERGESRPRWCRWLEVTPLGLSF